MSTLLYSSVYLQQNLQCSHERSFESFEIISTILKKRKKRIIFNKPVNYSCKKIFINEILMTLTSLYIYDCIKFSVLNDLISSDDMKPPHIYNTRHAFITNSAIKLKKSKHNVKYSSIQLFHALPFNIK